MRFVASRHYLVITASLLGLLLLITGIALTTRSSSNPLTGVVLFNDQSRQVASALQNAQSNKQYADAAALQQISSQPGATWLTGPSQQDPDGQGDVSHARKLSQQAAATKTTPVFVLYAIPNRDQCGGFSTGGFSTASAYLSWVSAITKSLATPAVFIVEPDAVAHAASKGCLNVSQQTARYNTLRHTLGTLKDSGKAKGVYLDAGNAEWFSDSTPLVSALQQSGIDQARGLAVNVSSFVTTQQSITWARQLNSKLGGTHGIVIDTSRNGNGAPASDVTGQGRWCNPAGRALGTRPTVQTNQANIDAYLWIKNAGESDGNCNNNPAAGTFSTPLALALVKNQ